MPGPFGPQNPFGAAVQGGTAGNVPSFVKQFFSQGGGAPAPNLGPSTTQPSTTTTNPATGRNTKSMPSTFPLPGATGSGGLGQFGLPTGPIPGGNAFDFLRRGGFPQNDLLGALETGGRLPSTDISKALMDLGGSALFSPQGLSNMDPLQMGFLQSFFETVLGIPFDAVLGGALQPFQGFNRGTQGRTQRDPFLR